MNKVEFDAAFKIAGNFEIDLSNVSDEHLFGCAIPTFVKTTTTVEAVAKLLRWQCFCLDGSIDYDELNVMRDISRKKFEIVGFQAEVKEHAVANN